jgi:molybdopterin-synthase adenylyltransferase
MTVDLGDRYSRQVLFPPIGPQGQARLAAARVLLVGCGGLGTVSANLLVRAGVGLLRIVDRDVVELSNLQRQALYDEEDVREARPKAIAAARRLELVNSTVRVEPVVADVRAANVRELLRDVELVVDGFDNFEGRYLLNDACVEAGLPWVYGACVSSSGLAALLVPGVTPCLRCLYRDPPEAGVSPTCDTVGVIGPVAHVTAAVQVSLALRYLVEGSSATSATLLSFDVWDAHFESVSVPRDPLHACPCCVSRQFKFLDVSVPPAVSLCGRNAVMVRSLASARPDFATLAARLGPLGEVVANPFLIRFRREGLELTLFADGRTIVKGTDSLELARSAVARYFGS